MCQAYDPRLKIVRVPPGYRFPTAESFLRSGFDCQGCLSKHLFVLELRA